MELVKKGYKKTEVGVIPEDWSCSTIGLISLDLVQGINTAIDIPEYVSDGIPMLKANDIIDGNMILEKADQISIKTYNSYSERFRIKKNDFLFSNIGARLGSGTLFKLDVPCSYAWNVMRITPNPKIIFPDYFSFAINSPKFFKLVTSNQMGSGMGFVPKNVLKKLQIPVPPTLTEQKAIADALTDVDELITNLEKLIAKKKAIKQGAMQQLLTPPHKGGKRLDGFSGDWVQQKVGDLFDISGGYSATREQLSDNGYCYLHYGDIHGASKTFISTKSDFESIPKLNISLKEISSKSILKDGDVIFVDASEDDEGVSRHIVIENEDDITFISGLHTIVAREKKGLIDNMYKRFCFQTKYIKEQFKFYAVGTKVSGISKSSIKNIVLFLPDLLEQKMIANTLNSMDDELQVLETKKIKSIALKQGMMQELLTGKTRLI